MRAPHFLPHGLRKRIHRLPPVGVLLGLFIIVPLCAYLAVGALRYKQHHVESERRLHRVLQVAREHALKVFESNETILTRVEEAVDKETADTLLNRERELHERLAQLSDNREQTQSIFIVGAEGHPLASDRVYPVPPGMNLADREYFKWHKATPDTLHFSERGVGRATGTPFFDMSLRWKSPDGKFLGVLLAGLSPSYFEAFHRELIANEQGIAITMLREDGEIFTRTPSLANQPSKLAVDSPVMSAIRSGRAGGSAMGMSSVDGQERLLAFTRIGKYPVYIGTGMAKAQIRKNWLIEMGWLAAFALPPMVGLYLAALLILRRTSEALRVANKLGDEMAGRKKAEGALLQAQKMEALGRLTGGVAHDFNNALMVISTNLFLLKRKDPDSNNPQYESIGRAVDAATKLTRQLLAFSRRQPLAPQCIDLKVWIADVQRLLKPLLGSLIELSVSVDKDVGSIWADAAELELALINLAVNAKDAMPGGGRFEISVSRARGPLPEPLSGEVIAIEATDTGCGIEPAIVEKVFEPFFTTKPVGQGTGLGLSQIFGLCQRTGGKAAIESKLGVGTTVSLFFPAALQCAGVGAAPAPAAFPNIGKTVLLVEDNLDVAAALVPLLEAMRCQVTHFDRAINAQRWLSRRAPAELPELLLSDVVMPGEIDGLALAMHVRYAYPAVKIVLMSGFAEHLDSIVALGFEIIPKPCTPQLLEGAISKVFLESDSRHAAH
jgi:signal transduction histidine kinase/CheY-like chemotaxis protein